MLFRLLDRPARFRRIPLALFDAVAAPLDVLSRLFPALAAKAELARIGRFYATEPMLLRNAVTGCYDAAATPAYGEDTLTAFYTRTMSSGLAGQELGDQALF